MPIYEYECGSCGHELEVIQKISDAPLRECPACGAASLIKKVSAPVFRLKGTGWYETDFKSGKKKQLADADTAGGGDRSKEDSVSSSDGKQAKDSKDAPAEKTGSSAASGESSSPQTKSKAEAKTAPAKSTGSSGS